MQNPTPLIPKDVVQQKIAQSGIKDVTRASIRELRKLVNEIEAATGQKFIRMEMGVPGLPPVEVGVEAQIAALRRGVARNYPDIQGLPELQHEIARFVKGFLDVTVDSAHCLPTVGSMMGTMVCFMTVNRMWPEREGSLFIDPGFGIQKAQCKLMGQSNQSFDVYDHRGPKLRDKLRSFLETGKVSSIIYSSPNNPAWFCFTEEELRTIGELATEHDVIVIEDLAYVGMDFRHDYSKPGVPPFQPTVAKFTDNYVLAISGSKAFSYAGERIGMLVVSDQTWNRRAPGLLRYFSTDQLGYSMLFGAIYAMSAGTSHSAQYALTAILKAANDGELNFVEGVKEYGEKAKIMKRAFIDSGFRIVYDRDLDEPIGDGFYFTFSYPGLTGLELMTELLAHGISAISLVTTGSERHEGLRACTSLIQRDQLPVLEERLRQFHATHGAKQR